MFSLIKKKKKHGYGPLVVAFFPAGKTALGDYVFGADTCLLPNPLLLFFYKWNIHRLNRLSGSPGPFSLNPMCPLHSSCNIWFWNQFHLCLSKIFCFSGLLQLKGLSCNTLYYKTMMYQLIDNSSSLTLRKGEEFVETNAVEWSLFSFSLFVRNRKTNKQSG